MPTSLCLSVPTPAECLHSGLAGCVMVVRQLTAPPYALLGETALREVILKQPAKFCALIAALQPQHFKFEHEHAVVALSPEEVRLRLAEARGKLLRRGH